MTSLLPPVDTDTPIDQEDFSVDSNSISGNKKSEIEKAYNESASRLSKVMKDNKLSDAQVSVWLDVTPKTIYNWRKRGGWSVLENTLLATYLKVDANWLATGHSQSYLTERKSANVVEFQRQAKHEGVNMPLIDRFLPAVSTAEIQKGKDFVHEIIKANAQSSGQRIGMSVAYWNEDVPGIPKYAIQMIIEDHKEDMPHGTLMGIADDISPIPGDYVIGNNDDEFVSGFFFPISGHLATSDRAGSYKKLKSFVLRRRLNSESSADIICTHENFELVGVCTYKAQWLTPSLLEEQTHMRDRMKKAFESRRLDDSS